MLGGEGVAAQIALNHQLAVDNLGLAVQQVDAGIADEVRRFQINGVVVQFRGGGHLIQLAGLEQGDLGGHGQCLGLVVGHIDDGGTQFLMEALQLGTHINAQLGVQVGQRLVKQQQLGAGGYGTGDGHPLLLAAGKLRGIAVLVHVNTHHPQGVHHPAVDLRLAHLLDLQAEGDVVVDRHVGPQGVGLEHQIQPPLAGLGVIGVIRVDHLHAVNGHGAVLGLFQSGNHTQRGGLAAAGGPQQGHEVAVLNGEVDVPQDVVAAVKFINVLQFNAAHIIFPFCSVTIPGLTYSC